MRIPVFARRSNPAVARPILRKSIAYCQAQVRSGLAEWVDSLDYGRGIVALEYLPSGKQVETVAVDEKSIDDSYIGLKRVATAPEWKNPTLPHIEFDTRAQHHWDWSGEPAIA